MNQENITHSNLYAQVSRLTNKEALHNFINNHQNPLQHNTAAPYFLKILKTKNLTPWQIQKQISQIKIAGKDLIERSYLANFLAERKALSRDNLIILALLSNFTTEEANELLSAGNFQPLYARNKRDALLLFAFQHRPEEQNSSEFYLKTEKLLQNQKQNPLCRKLPPPLPPTKQEIILPNTEISTQKLAEELTKLNYGQLTAFFTDHNQSLLPYPEQRNQLVAVYLTKCAAANGLPTPELIQKIWETDLLSLSAIYHLLNNKGNKGFTRNNILAIGIIAGLNFEQINRALKYNSNPLLKLQDNFDFCYTCCLFAHLNFEKTEEELALQDLPPLSRSGI